MYYVGKFFKNMKGLYDEINPATLTGAIDVIIVRQKDGTYATSPWHVRFGKMSVIRTREKVVDIEINGEPVDLHMKLGEAGEAFFVQETDDLYELPAHLATSPISPALTEMEAGLAALKASSCVASNVPEDPLTPVIEHCGTVITMEDGKMVVSGIPPNIIADNDRPYYSDSDAPGSSLSLSRRRRQKETVATQTNLTSTDIERVDVTRPATPPSDWYSGLARDIVSTVNLSGAQQKTVACSLPAMTGPMSAPQLLKNRLPRPPPLNIIDTENDVVVERAKNTTVNLVSAEDCQFEMDLSDEEQIHSPLSRIADSADLSMLSRCISMPTIHQINDIVDNWATKQYAATALGGFIDETPTTSPLNSRPMSPSSDSEILTANHDATSQTNLTGDRLNVLDDVKWQWGELPESTSTSRFSAVPTTPRALLPGSHLLKDHHGSAVIAAAADENKSVVIESLTSELNAAVLSTISANSSVTATVVANVVETCVVDLPTPESKKPSAKKPCQTLADKGIYLDDLTQDEPELAALYLYNHKRSTPPPRVTVTKDEDSESGRGASLPQSPVTVESESHETSQRKHLSNSTSSSSSAMAVAMSLCGPLDHEDAVISDERFNQYLVSHDALNENPAVVLDPNLVVRIDGKLYNWAIAAPMILSNVAFNRSLSEACMARLINQHLPKKETAARRGWLFWRRGETGASTSVSSATITGKESGSAPASHQPSPPDTPQKSKIDNRPAGSRVENILITDDDVEVLGMPTSANFKMNLEAPLVHSTGREKCRKSLKLTSDEIARLNLKDGVNEVTFSVTTQYQGTTKCQCYVYLWQWDDRIVVSDIDGTITKSDVLGQVLPMIGSVLPYISTDWSQAGIAQLYQMISRNGYKFLYLSARAIGQSKYTRDYLRGVRQSDTNLPDGPLLLSPSSLMSAFHKEVIERKPEQFKISCLRDISALFPPTENPFIAGFGNKINDVWAYREVGIPMSRIFTVNHKGEVRMDSTQAFLSSYKKLSDIVDHLFPPRLPQAVDSLIVSNNYNSFCYWRNPVDELDSSEINKFVQSRDATASSSTTDKGSDAKKAAAKKQTAPATRAKSKSSKPDVKTTTK